MDVQSIRERVESALRRVRPTGADEDVVGAQAHRELARQAVRQSLVLLKNNGGVLPLNPGSRILVAGDGADNIGKQAGGWTISWQGTGNVNEDFPGATSILDGIRAAVEPAGGEVEYSKDGSWSTRPDVAVVVYGEDPYAEGQGDLESIVYSAKDATDRQLLESLSEAGIPVVSVFLSGRPMWVNPELNASDAFVAAWLPGSEGVGVADVLIGNADGEPRHDFVGKLSFSWPRSPEQVDVNRGDADYDPLFPYGYGLTYADASEVEQLPVDVAATVGESDDAGLVIFEGDSVDPWRLYVGDGSDWSTTAASTENRSAEGVVSVSATDRNRQGDIRRIRWSGTGSGQVYFQSEEPQDLTEPGAAGGLVFEVAVHQAPTSAVTLRMDCEYPCSGGVDVTQALRDLPADDWQVLRLDLQCLARAGAELDHVDTPFLLTTDGELELSLATVELEPDPTAEANIPCSLD